MKQHLQSRMAQRGEGGFTLIELLVVIAILGILSAVVVFAVGNSTDKAQKRACKIERRTLVTAVEVYKAESDSSDFPTGLDIDPPAATATDIGMGDVVTILKGEQMISDDSNPADIASRWEYDYVPGNDGVDTLPNTDDDVPSSFLIGLPDADNDGNPEGDCVDYNVND